MNVIGGVNLSDEQREALHRAVTRFAVATAGMAEEFRTKVGPAAQAAGLTFAESIRLVPVDESEDSWR